MCCVYIVYLTQPKSFGRPCHMLPLTAFHLTISGGDQCVTQMNPVHILCIAYESLQPIKQNMLKSMKRFKFAGEVRAFTHYDKEKTNWHFYLLFEQFICQMVLRDGYFPDLSMLWWTDFEKFCVQNFVWTTSVSANPRCPKVEWGWNSKWIALLTFIKRQGKCEYITGLKVKRPLCCPYYVVIGKVAACEQSCR